MGFLKGLGVSVFKEFFKKDRREFFKTRTLFYSKGRGADVLKYFLKEENLSFSKEERSEFFKRGAVHF